MGEDAAGVQGLSHKLRSKETQGKGMTRAEEQRCMQELPEAVHWRVHLEMADLAKREKNFHEARRLYRLATGLQPSAPQTWLEYAKMEEERGHFERCRLILMSGLEHCPYHEALMLKAIKHLERMGDLRAARALLGTLHRVPINQSWRTLLEGALLEARTAETDTARRVFKFLLTQAPWYGPVWHEACRFEQRCNHLTEALNVAEQGLNQLPRYGPLWFCALRLYECTSSKGDLMRATRSPSTGACTSRRTWSGSCGSSRRRWRSGMTTCSGAAPPTSSRSPPARPTCGGRSGSAAQGRSSATRSLRCHRRCSSARSTSRRRRRARS